MALKSRITIQFLILTIALLFQDNIAALAEKRVALVIGNSSYENDKSGNVNVTSQVNAQIIEKCTSLVRQFGVVFVGVDLICNDITAGFNQDNCRIGEINTTPGLHHHYLIANPQQGNPIGEIVLDHMLISGVGTMTIGKNNGNPEGMEIRNADGKNQSYPAFGASAKNPTVAKSLEYQ